MKKKHKVVMLATEDQTRLAITDTGVIGMNKEPLKVKYGKNQHLYILSDDEIEENDYGYDPIINKVFKIESIIGLPNKVYKIIATTNPKLTKQDDEYLSVKNLPQIPQSFIEQYVKEQGIDEVELEYEGIFVKKPDGLYSGEKLKLVNNEVVIHQVEKKLYTKDEVIQLFKNYARHRWNGVDIDTFIKENL